MDLSQLTTEEIRAELQRREAKLLTPLDVDVHTFKDEISTMLANMVEKAIQTQYWDEDNDVCLAEKVQELLYGDLFFSWLKNL